jgi:transposase
MTTQEAIQALHQRGYSKRKISRELGIHRRTVDRYLGKSSKSPSCSGAIPPDNSKCTTPSPGSEALQPSENASQKSACEPFRETIEKKLAQGLPAKRIWQDLVPDHRKHDIAPLDCLGDFSAKVPALQNPVCVHEDLIATKRLA